MNPILVFVLGYLVGRVATGETLQQAIKGGFRQISPALQTAAAQANLVEPSNLRDEG